ncbi:MULTISPECIES: ArgE/DapE family deacylase [Rhodopseudomonas]|uniref:Acetylornithine deacetylase n=1 Tax=Rhodopseudomonas palustris TaxID=1076 RepID=A0A0D7EYZ7_RHOPL|nr:MULTISPECIES: ArgE/DapE family deacylase [Rhodopseudomonas]KIZ45811.1 acetylornithine deacetylase [Rhodopseudomonas palustris]MDF3812401.1 ArgE/DapE family deacylase [Rhodopseudomonas sp. BAL398]WOK17248.1 ArgE/DapE family deacylase [Rhodopseudomonas sp. BAL398]
MTLDSKLRDQIISAVEQGFDAQVKFTQEMVRHVSTRGNEHTMQDYMFRAMKERGYTMERFEMDREALARHPGSGAFDELHSRAPIVVGIHRPREEKGRSLIMQGHVDVVPEGAADMWATPPFEPVIDGDWMQGRGAADMKAGAASNIFALDALKRLGLQPAATVYLQSVVEEESTGDGALMTHLRGYKADAALVSEPSHETLTRANIGVIWFQLEVRGVPVHVQRMGTGANAIDAAYRVIGELRRMEMEWNKKKDGLEYFKDIDKPINLNVGKIAGGDWASSVPSWCKVDCRISILPGTSAEQAKKEIVERVAAFTRDDAFLSNMPPTVTFNGFQAEGYVLKPGSDAEAVLGRAHQAVFGRKLETVTSLAYLDSRVYVLFDDIPALNYGAISRGVHGVDEGVNLPSLKKTTTAMALFIAEWCGLEQIAG